MAKYLVIVESPAKAKTIGKYLGSHYTVEASMGHVRDLPKSQLGVDVEKDFEPKYISIRGKGELLNKLRREAKKADKVYLATDPDREGEAISWHLANILKLDGNDKIRIEFNEITKDAVKNSLKAARPLKLDLIDAQQARRILDRLVGYEISPILWRNVKWGLSAGRVQSAALKLICDREEEIKNFKPEEYWTIDADLLKDKTKVTARLTLIGGKKARIEDETTALAIKADLDAGKFHVSKVVKSEKKRNPLPPFTTSTLQQDASKKLNFQTRRTMSVAQQLYEGVDIKKMGSIGLITYMRTDSVRVSPEAQAEALKYIKEEFGDRYCPAQPRIYKGKKNIQDAHEAIRPSNVHLDPESIKDSLKPEQYKLYKLIWQRFLASQMESAVFDTITAIFENGKYTLRATGSKMKFDGFMKLYEYKDDKEENTSIPELNEGETLKNGGVRADQHFTQPPARFTEASFVKTLEELGIGRPSTYAPTISTLLARDYIEREKKNLLPTDLGKIVNQIMKEYFKNIVNVEFTANMEERLDSIEEGSEPWRKVVRDYYEPLKKDIEFAEQDVEKVTIEDEISEELCPNCGKNLVVKRGRYGKFLACPDYPECKHTQPIVEKLDVKCPKCSEGDVVAKKSRKGNKFFGCSRYPECDYVSWYEPTTEICQKCGSMMHKRYSKAKGTYLACSNDACKATRVIEKTEDDAE
ncbi:type I DNA topoisomerase [Proteiniclasticum sp. QWL-01]|nr:type I DNA topoisomerase [Proteiniclasticum sp. QWL-01]WFF74277.1 type I DNA topoisomerase [Proteiniclasticum sp. QWL-01]